MGAEGFCDEFIQKARREREKLEEVRHSEEVVEEEIKQSIYDEVVTIFGIPVIFRDHSIIEDKAVMRMPEDFTPRTEDEIASVYFLGSRPGYVFSNGYLNFMTAFNWTNNLMPDASIFDFTKFAKDAIDRIGPKTHFMNEEKITQEGTSLAILQFVSQTIDSVNYNVMFFTSLEGRLLIGSVTFDQKYAKRLLPLVLEMVKSFRIKQVEEEVQS
ncbi:MAG: hypothetical protein J6C19_06650 [Lachnospiraceae bacterium]|nr:hypothetical protein [Lachnospiraceae bacterium]